MSDTFDEVKAIIKDLLGADVIPDMFRTMANVTGGIAAAAIVDRSMPNDAREERL